MTSMLELAQLGNQVNTDTLEEDVQVNPNALLSTTALINAGAAVNKQSSERAARRTMKVVEPIGAVLQPFQAPQQLLFGIVGAIGSAATGKGDPLQVLGRGAGAALDFATFGATAYLPKGDSRKTAVRGYDLAKGAGIPDYLARPLGLAADFFVDPLLIGSLPAKFIGGTARVAGETATISTMFEARVGENMRQAFFVNGQLDGAAFGQFAKNIAAAPFTTAPIRTALKGVPVGMRQKAAEDFGTFLENTRQVPLKSRNELLGVNASELIISKFGNVPGIPAFNTKAFVETGQSKGVGMPEQFLNDWRTIDTIKANLAVRANEIQITRNKMAPYVSPAQSTEMDKKIGGYLDGTFTPADKLKQRVELEHYAESIGVKPNDLNKLITQTVELDTYAALMRGAASVMNIKEVTKYAIGRDLVGAYREGGQAAVEELAAKYSRFDSPMATALNTLTPGLQRAEKHSMDALEAGDKAFKVTDFRTLADADMVKKINALVVQIGDAPTGMVPTPKPNVAVADLLGPDEVHRGFDEILNGNYLDDAFKADINNMIATKGKGKKAALLELESEGFEVYAKNPDGTPGARIDPAKLRSSKKKFNVDSYLILPTRDKVGTIASSVQGNFSDAVSITGKVNMESAASSSFAVPNTSTLTFNQRFLIRQASGELGEIASKTAIDNQALIAPSILDAIRVRSGLSRYDQAPNDLLANKKMIEQGISSGSHEAMYLNSVMKDLSYGYREGGLLPQTKAAVDDLSRGLEGKLHFRRQFLATTDPESAISQLDMNMTYKIEVDKPKLESTFEAMIAAGPAGNLTAKGMADEFQAAVYNKVGVEPTDALAAYFTDKGFDENQILSFLGSMGDDIPGITAMRGKDYYPLVRPFLDQMKASPNGVGNVALGSANPFARDTELPQEWIEMMAQIHDIAKVVHDNAKITGSMVVKRGQVSLIHKELSDAGAIIDALPYGSNLGWRRIDEGMAAALKGTGETSEGVWSNMPFKEGQYIPAAFHRLLVDTVKIDSPGVTKAAYQYFVGAWKQHMVGNPGGITRDVMGSLLMGMNRGVGAKQWMEGMGEMAELMALARKGDGIFDPKAVSKSGIYASEMVENGDLINHNMIAVEIKEPLRQFSEALYGGKEGAKFLGATKQGDPAQRIAAAIVNFNAGYRETLRASGKLKGRQVAGKIGMAAVDAGLGLGGPITGAFSDMKGMADSIMRGGLYITMRKRGMAGPEAARFADETMFNYSEVPMIVDTMRRNGLSPFASFQALSAGRFLRTIYENPYAIARFYRIPDGIKAQNREENAKLDAASPDRLKKALWVPVGKKDGVHQFANLSAFLTETGTFSAFSSDAVSAYAPPALELWSSIMTGEGFGGSKIYEGGGTLTETPHDQAVRGVLKSVYRAGLTPWAVGSPMFERIAKSIAERTVSKESMGDPKIQALLGYFTEGAFVEGSRQLGIIPKSPITPKGKLSGPTLEPLDALAGIFGISYALVDTNPQHMGGSASINVKNEIKNLDNRKRLLVSEIIRANGNQRLIAEAKQRYNEDKGPLKDRLDGRKDALR